MELDHFLELLWVSCLGGLVVGLLLLVFFRFASQKILIYALEKQGDLMLRPLATRMRKELETVLYQKIGDLTPKFKEELAQAFSQEIEKALPRFREEISKGFRETGRELLPEYRKASEQAFQDAFSKVFSGKMVEKTALSVAKKGTDLVGNSLDLLFGAPQKK